MNPKHVFILTGGIGAGKSKIANQLAALYGYVIGSPADTMKRSLAKAIAAEYSNSVGVIHTVDWVPFFQQMCDQRTKTEYRLLLQGYGEFFSNRDPSYWAEQCVKEAEQEFNTKAEAGVATGIVFDSIRRPTEITTIQNNWPDAVHVRLYINPERQYEFLHDVLDYSDEKIQQTLSHSSEHWLDDMHGQPYDANYVIDANHGDEMTWSQFLAVTLMRMMKHV